MISKNTTLKTLKKLNTWIYSQDTAKMAPLFKEIQHNPHKNLMKHFTEIEKKLS